jgi:signal transduction histidine kinase
MSKFTPARVLRSLRSRILLLTLLVCILIASALTGFFLLLRQTQSAIMSGSAAHLLSLVNSFARDYSMAIGSSNNSDALQALNEEPNPHADSVLREFSINAFQRDPGIEGGFYSLATGGLLGYAFPTNDGPGPKQDIPPRERPTILAVAQQAATTGTPAALTFRGQSDVILFQAVPLSSNGKVFGSVWAMHRIHDANSGRDLQALLGVSCLALAAMICVAVAFWVTRNVQADVSTIQDRLTEMEVELNQPRKGNVSTSELDGILTGIDKLGISLQQKIEKERQLVEQLHHKERLAALGQVAAGVAHELRNPLATIRLRAQMSMRSKDPELLDRSAKLTLEEIDRLSGVLDRLLYFAKPIQLQVKSFRPAQLCEDLLSSLRPEAQAASIELVLMNSDDMELSGDALKLRQVLENLVRNAMESFEPTGPGVQRKIVISLLFNTAKVHVRVEDNGMGMRPEIATRVFDPFFTTKVHGTGLGLSIAKEIVRAHHGDLTLEGIANGGTVAELVLPRQPEEPRNAIEPKKDSTSYDRTNPYCR